MFKKILLALIILFTVSTLTVAADEVSIEPGATPILFVREGCTHCAKVEAFLDDNNLNDQVKITETYNNEENSNLLNAWGEHFNIPENQRGVPFLVVDNDTYYAGDTPIINYLADKNNIEVKEASYQSSSSDLLMLGLGGAFLLAVLGYGVYSVFKKK